MHKIALALIFGGCAHNVESDAFQQIQVLEHQILYIQQPKVPEMYMPIYVHWMVPKPFGGCLASWAIRA